MCSSMPLNLFLAKSRPNTLVRGVHIRRRTTTCHGPYRMNEAMVHELETHPSRSLPCCGLSWPSEHRSELVRPPDCSELPSCIVCGHWAVSPTTAQGVCDRNAAHRRKASTGLGPRAETCPLAYRTHQMADALSRIDCMVSARCQEIGVR